ncbi:MAG: hypothetical protein QOF36_2435 [Microbacteriaceae bacterium]|jgi:uncharacterized protein YdeI (YjbR/CyaY-like superfamily)|nr:hypothetical protein [Microbacteriaceae bacterium]
MVSIRDDEEADVVDREIMHFADAADWAAWLEEHHADSPGVRVAIAKKGSAKPGPSYAEALDAALCYGWIDGQARRLDDDYYLQLFTPRRSRSVWSQINREHIARLTEAGAMRPAGMREVERAKSDGRWDAAYAPQRTIEVPDDLAAALAASPAATEVFASLSSQNRYAILFRIGNAKRQETRDRRVADFVAMLERGETIYPQERT